MLIPDRSVCTGLAMVDLLESGSGVLESHDHQVHGRRRERPAGQPRASGAWVPTRYAALTASPTEKK